MTVDYTKPPQPGQPQRGWWSRNWKWVVPVGCLSIIVAFLAFAGVIVAVVFGAIKSSDAYRNVLHTAQQDPRVIAALGTPIEPGFFVTGNINVNNDRGTAQIDFPISGPKGKAKVHAEGEKSSGKWEYSVMQARVEGGETIDLLHR
ncbi:MAG: cytochrome c oxidase assembly factor Coa1 family protein [Thermoanaerobaculia bacterium]